MRETEMRPLATKNLVHELIYSKNLDERLCKFPNINREFPKEIRELYYDDSPYYCHFMQWRIALYPDDFLTLFDSLLGEACSIDGWEEEKINLYKSRSFGEYWSLLWQLQVADWLMKKGFDLKWENDGPDLKANDEYGHEFFVECTCPRGIETWEPDVNFIEDLLYFLPLWTNSHIPFEIRLHKDICKESSFSRRPGIYPIPGLDEFVEMIRDSQWQIATADYLRKKRPYIIEHSGTWNNATPYADIPSIESSEIEYDPGALIIGHVNPVENYRSMMHWAVEDKKDKDDLPNCHPNILFINDLLRGGSLGKTIAEACGYKSIPLNPETPVEPIFGLLPDSIDTVAWGSFGIDRKIFDSEVSFYTDGEHPNASCVKAISEFSSCNWLFYE